MAQHQALADLNLSNFAVEYADVRIEESTETWIVFKNGQQLELHEVPIKGALLRVYHKGRWHEAATTNIDGLSQELSQLVRRALGSSPGIGKDLFKREPRTHDFSTYHRNNCTYASLEQKSQFCRSLLGIVGDFTEIVDWSLVYADLYKRKWFKAKDGVEFYADYNQAGVCLRYSLKRGDQLFDDVSSVWFMNPTGQEEKTNQKIRKEIQESLLFLGAEGVTAGKYQVLLSPEVTGVFAHESFGHRSESDFMLGDTAMLREWRIGKVVASPLVSIVDEGDAGETSGYCPIDDEGNRKQKTYLIKNGKLAGRLHGVSTALALGEASTGNGRAVNFEFGPIVRMTNTYLDPGVQSVAEVIVGIKKGIYIKTFKHGMGMSTFTIAPGKAYWIENGEITRPVKVSVISGSVFETLMNISGVANDFEIKSSALGGCGKFEQFPLPVSYGGPSILVDSMQVS